jgi:DNA repair exonuclease SbcCD nuclease subunit
MSADNTQEDDVLRLLHTADWHLGMDFPSFAEEQRRTLRRARLEAIDTVFLTASRRRTDAVLCAGDLFDDPMPADDVWRGLADKLKGTDSHRPIFLLPGNHDPLTSDSIWSHPRFRAELPAWVHVVDSEPFEMPIGEGAVLYAVPCRSKAGQSDPTRKIPGRDPSDKRIRIGLVHGSTFDMPGVQVDFPIAKDAAIERGLDYLAIGDTHGFRIVPPERPIPPTVYPGTPEPTAFEEHLPGNVVVVGFSSRREARVEAEPVARFKWERAVVTQMRELRALAKRDLRRAVLHLVVELRLGRAEYDEARDILADLAGSDDRAGHVGVLELNEHGVVLEAGEADWAEFAEPIRIAAERLRALTARPDTRAKAERAIAHLYAVARKSA